MSKKSTHIKISHDIPAQIVNDTNNQKEDYILNKIRAEIADIELLAEYSRGDIKNMALDIIDKYMVN